MTIDDLLAWRKNYLKIRNTNNAYSYIESFRNQFELNHMKYDELAQLLREPLSPYFILFIKAVNTNAQKGSENSVPLDS